MDTWHLLLYAVACFLALRTLISLMASHQTYFVKQRRMDEEANRLRAALDEKEALKLAENVEALNPREAASKAGSNVNSDSPTSPESDASRAA